MTTPERRIILLAGLHKTGTTSFQQTCENNRNALLRAGFIYPRFVVHGQDASNHTAVMNWMWKRDPGRRGLLGQFQAADAPLLAQRRQRLRAALRATLQSTPGRMILAAEGVSLLGVDELQAMRQWFEQQGWSIDVLCHVRHLGDWFNSMIAQRVVGPFRLTIADAVDEFARAGGLVRPRIEAIRQAFPQARLQSHEQAVRHAHGPVGFMLEAIGVPGGAVTQFVRGNEGASAAAVRAISQVNEKHGRFGADGRRNPDFIRDADLQHLRQLPGEKFRLTAAEVAPVLALLKAENQWLLENFGADFHDDALGWA